MFYVYILLSQRDNKQYTGFSKNLKRRIEAHNNGLNESTKSRLPLKLIYYEAYLSEKDARKREKFLKSGKGRELIRKQIADSIGGCSSIG
ncbi:MAG: GIY-YIG nuclease family protein [Candidatus Roizmanbacteria bacterium]|nr:GIY-YIG nuclease family protein [Candidatus Roizmanbacteria bacterium]